MFGVHKFVTPFIIMSPLSWLVFLILNSTFSEINITAHAFCSQPHDIFLSILLVLAFTTLSVFYSNLSVSIFK